MNHMDIFNTIRINVISVSLIDSKLQLIEFQNFNYQFVYIYHRSMKPIFKVLSSPFRSSKSKKSKKQPDNQLDQNIQQPIDAVCKKEQHEKGIKLQGKNLEYLKSLRPQDIYNQVDKMIDQLASMFSFKQKMTETQKKQLIADLSSMVIASKGMQGGNRLMQEDVYDDEDYDDQEEQNKCSQQVTGSKIDGGLTRASSLKTSQNSPSSQQLPEKELYEMFESFERDYKGQAHEPENNQVESPENNLKSAKKVTKQISFSSFSQIKDQMGKFWCKNSTKVLNLMTPRKQSRQLKTFKKYSLKEISATQSTESVMLKKKSSFSLSSYLPSFNGKKQQKTLNSTAATIVQNSKSLIEQNYSFNVQKKQLNGQLQWECSSLGFNNTQQNQ